MSFEPTAALRALAALAVAAAPAAPQGTPLPHFEQAWGGETRQVFSLEVGSDRHVWTVGDGPLIRHAINPGATTTWSLQSPPSGVTQNLLDVHFIPGPGGSGPAHVGFACGLNGNVLTSADYGATWVHLDGGEVQNQLTPSENATLWRSRFTSEDFGFACGLWTFQNWDGTDWSPVTLLDAALQPMDAATIEFYSLELVVDPSDPSRWVGIAAGQKWDSPGGGSHLGDSGIVFQGRWNYQQGLTWVEVFRTEASGTSYEDPWDVEFEPDPPSITQAVGYLCAGTGHPTGAVFRTANSGRTWNPVPDLAGATTLYGIGVLDADNAVAAGYGGQIWTRDASGWTCRRGAGCTAFPGESQAAPLAGVHGEDPDVYVTGSWGYLRLSSDDFATSSVNLQPAASEGIDEHWRFQDVHFTSDTRGYSVSANKTIIDSVNGGLEWDISPTSPNGLLGPVTGLLQGIDFQAGGGSGVAVGIGEVSTLAVSTVPTLNEAFAFYYDEQGSATWTKSQTSFSMGGWTTLDLQDVAWASGSGSAAEFWAVGTASGSSAATAALLRSTNGGATWSDGDAASGGWLNPGARLTGIDFRSATEGFLVGYVESTAAAIAYRLDLSGSSPLLTEIPVTSGAGTWLLGVAANGTFVAAVGQHESVFVYQATPSPAFVPLTVPSLGFSTDTSFLSIAAPPGNDPRVLIGASTSDAEVNAPGLGKVLYYANGWHTLPAATNKDVHAVFLRANVGFALAGGPNSSGEVGMVGDGMVLRLVPAISTP